MITQTTDAPSYRGIAYPQVSGTYNSSASGTLYFSALASGIYAYHKYRMYPHRYCTPIIPADTRVSFLGIFHLRYQHYQDAYIRSGASFDMLA